MGAQPAEKPLYRFGPFSLNPTERLLLRENEPLALTPKAFDLLVLLVANAGHLLEKDLLMRQLWSDAFVEEANLSNNISLLRKTLDAGIDAEYIETVPRRGYRFSAAVTVGDSSDRAVLPASISPALGLSPDLDPNPGMARSRKKLQFAAVVAVLLISVVVVAMLRRADRVESNVRPVRFPVAPPQGTALPATPRAISPAISLDGTQLVFRVVRQGELMLAIRVLDSLNARVLDGTERGAFPFWSPDSRSVAFFADGKLKTIDASGGPVRTICDAASGTGGTWNREGVILFGTQANNGLFRVPGGGRSAGTGDVAAEERDLASTSDVLA